MVGSKIASTVAKKGLKRAGKTNIAKQAGFSAGAVAAAEALENNPWVSAAEGAATGYVIGSSVGTPLVGGLVGAAAGGITGFLMADGERIVPCDMIAIPAYQYSALLTGKEPTFQIFIKEGELITPILPTDAMQNTAALEATKEVIKPKRKLSAWQRYIKVNKNKIYFKSGKRKGQLNLKAMSKEYNRGKK